MKLFLAFLVLLNLNVMAASGENKIDLGAGVAIPVGVDAIKTAYDAGIAASLGWRHGLSEKFSLGLSYNLLDYKGDTVTNHAFYLLGRYDFTTSGLKPFAQLGLGLAHVKINTTKYSKPAMMLGLGLSKSLSECLDLEFTVNFHHIQKRFGDTTEQNILAPMLGLTYTFGKTHHEEAVKEMVEEKVEEAAPVISDADGDGVADLADICPDTAKGVEVNKVGCKLGKEVALNLNVKFDSGKSVVKEEFTQKLDMFGKALQVNKDMKAEIQGYTDSRGRASLNTRISAKRAKAVVAYLVSNFGIEASRLKAVGYGSKNPVASNKTAAGREENRRVEGHIILNK